MFSLNLHCSTESINRISLNVWFKGFRFNNRIISVTHGKPIDEDTIYHKEDKLTVVTNVVWNELLILEDIPIGSKKSSDPEPKKFTDADIRLKLPKVDINLILYNNLELISFSVINYDFLCLNGLPTNPRCLYVKAHTTNCINLQSLSGSPVFTTDNKLVGVFCKQSIINGNNYIYILPIYYVIKSISKIDNTGIYGIDYTDDIYKINNNIVSNGEVYHKSFHHKIPLDVYYLLEGDCSNNIIINKVNSINYVRINDRLPILNEQHLHYEKDLLLVNTSLLLMLKLIAPRVIGDFINFVRNHLGSQMYCSITKSVITDDTISKEVIIKDDTISKEVIINEDTFIITLFL
jgi:hypothetical protein